MRRALGDASVALAPLSLLLARRTWASFDAHGKRSPQGLLVAQPQPETRARFAVELAVDSALFGQFELQLVTYRRGLELKLIHQGRGFAQLAGCAQPLDFLAQRTDFHRAQINAASL